MARDADSVVQAGAAPRPMLSVPDGIVLLCGMVIGVGIFKAPSVVAGATSSAAATGVATVTRSFPARNASRKSLRSVNRAAGLIQVDSTIMRP